MKQKIPPFNEMIEQLYQSIVKRHPEEPAGEKLLEKLKFAWRGKNKDLYKMVKQLRINEYKAEILEQKTEIRELVFQNGVDFLGFPTFVKHIVRFENKTIDPHRYKKQGSKFLQEQTHAMQVEYKEGFNLKSILDFKKNIHVLN